MNLIFFIVLAACACFVNGQTNSCVTPGGRSGECVSIYNCQVLLQTLRRIEKRTHTGRDVEELKRSQCGFQGGSPAVCCPKQDQQSQLPRGSCFTPEGTIGQCISLYSCSHLANLLNPPIRNENLAYIQSAVCEGPEQYSVCCDPPQSPPPPTRTNNQDTTDKSTDCAAQMNAFPPDPSTECCGIDSRVGNKIVGGTSTTVDQYPWLVLIEYTQLGEPVPLQCGGALISGKYVLTAAHCVTGRILNLGTPKMVRLGEYDTSHDGPDCAPVDGGGEDCTEGVIRIRIEKFIAHRQYSSISRRNDIGLIRMAKTAPFTEFIRPICLPTSDLTDLRNIPENFTLYAAGWGAVSSLAMGSSNIKLHVDLPYISRERCQPAYRVPERSITLWRAQICAGGFYGKDSCKGDSGGPLMYEDGRTYQVIGIVSFGPTPCGLDGVPGIYSKVYEYLDWIRNTIEP